MPLKLYEKEKILDSCFLLFAENGYTKTTTIMLSEAAGISKALLFHHFKSKKKLYIQVLERCFDKMALEMKVESLEDFKDFFEFRGRSSSYKIDYLREHPDISKLLFDAFHRKPDQLKDELVKFSHYIMKKYGEVEIKRFIQIKKLFDLVPLREEVDSDSAYKLVNIVMDHFKERIAVELTDVDKINDDDYWDALFLERKKFLDMIRYGIEKKGGE